jgi:spore germination protein YaaH
VYKQLQLRILKRLIFLTIALGILFFYIDGRSGELKVLSPFKQRSHLFTLLETTRDYKNVIYGYLPWWSVEDIDYIQLDKLTDVAYFGVYLNQDGSFKKVIDNGMNEPGYSRWVSSPKLAEFIQKAKKYNVRVSLTLVAHEDNVIDNFLSCRECWKNVVKNLKAEMNKHGVTSVNLNFEHGGQTSMLVADQFVEFTDYVNKEMDKEYGESFVVVSAFADSYKGYRVSSNIKGLSEVSDGIFIMGYDFHRPQSANAGPVAPLDGITEVLNEFLKNAKPEKIILGVPYYGYNWVTESLDNRSNRLEGNDIIGYSQTQIYANIINMISELNIPVYWDERGNTPYVTYISPETGSYRQLHYENKDSLRQKYVLSKQRDLLGVGIWALGYDGGYSELWDLLAEEFWK